MSRKSESTQQNVATLYEDLVELTPNDDAIDLEKIYNLPIYATEAVNQQIDASATTPDERDEIIWRLAYMSAMNRIHGEERMALFRARVGPTRKAYFVELKLGYILISRAD